MPKIPEFTTLDEVAVFWDTHDSGEYWEDMEKVAFDVDFHQNMFHPHLTILTERPEICPRCHQELQQEIIQYIAQHQEHLLVIRDVPILRCKNDHEYLLETTLDMLEHVLQLEHAQRLQPAETMQVPVFSLKYAYG